MAFSGCSAYTRAWPSAIDPVSGFLWARYHPLTGRDYPFAPMAGDRLHASHAGDDISTGNPDNSPWTRQDSDAVHDLPHRPILDPLDLRWCRRGLRWFSRYGGRGSLEREWRILCCCRLPRELSLPRAGCARKVTFKPL
jgi:hypothetical protein